MMSSLRSDHATRIYPEPPCIADSIDRFDILPDSLLLLIFINIGDVKTLGRCSLVSKRFQSLIPQVENVVVRVDCVISDDDSTSAATAAADKSRGPLSSLVRLVFGGIVKPILAIGQLLGTKRSSSSSSSSSALFVGNSGELDGEELGAGSVTHHSPTQVLKNFNEIRFLKIELPSGELGIDREKRNRNPRSELIAGVRDGFLLPELSSILKGISQRRFEIDWF